MTSLKAIPKSLREKVRERDKACRICGKPLAEHEGHIHHIYGRYATIPDYLGIPLTPHNNHEYNLVLLCERCHERIHRIGMTQHQREKLIVENMERRKQV